MQFGDEALRIPRFTLNAVSESLNLYMLAPFALAAKTSPSDDVSSLHAWTFSRHRCVSTD